MGSPFTRIKDAQKRDLGDESGNIQCGSSAEFGQGTEYINTMKIHQAQVRPQLVLNGFICFPMKAL